ncbi:MAG: hypothetical protein ACJAXY_000994 [Nonlabens sp.]|jgi:hypothetical protein
MKRVFILCLLLLQVIAGHAQLQATLNVDSNPTPELSEWVNRTDLAILTVTNPSPQTTVEYRIRVRLLLEGTIKLITDETVPYMTADFGTETFLADELIPYNAVQFIDRGFRDQISRTGLLPPGSYSFCVELLNREGRGLTQPEQICRPMIITDYQMPELLDPVANRLIDPILINSIMFKWTPLAPIPDPRTGLTYLIAVSEVQPGQIPSQAFSVNYPIIEEEVLIGTQFTWPIDIEAPDEDQQYVWGIKPITQEGNTYRSQNNGFVDYGVFTIGGKNNTTRGQEDDTTGNTKDQDDVADTQGLIGSKGCKFPSQSDFESVVNFINSSPDDPLKIQLVDVQAFTMNLRAEVANGGELTDVTTFLAIDYGGVHSLTSNADGMSTSADHSYTYSCKAGADQSPTQVCFIYKANKVVKGVLVSCEKTYCIDLPEETIAAIEELEAPGIDDAQEEECACLDASPVSIPTLTMDYSVNVVGDEHTLTIPGSSAALQGLIDCMKTYEIFTGAEGEDGHPEINLQEAMFTGTVTHEWHIPDAMTDPSNTHMFTVLEGDVEPLPESVTVTFHIVNTNAGIDCYFTQDVPVPHDAYNAINGEEECECDDETAPPELVLLRPQPTNEPRQISLGGVIAYRDYLLECNSNYSLTTHSMEVTLNWDTEDSEESIAGAGPFVHDYAIDHPIPDQLCATFTITPLFPSSYGQACVTTVCVDTPEEWLELNVEAGTGELALGDLIFSGTKIEGIGEFTTTVTSITGDPGGPYSGTGTTMVNWLSTEIHTEFTEITVDDDTNLVTGIITGQIHDTAPVYPLAWALGVVGGVNISHPQAENVLDWISTQTGQEIDYDPVTGAVLPVKMPLGVNFPSGDQLAITEMVFRADESEFNLVAAKTTPVEWGPIQLVGFRAINIKHHILAPVWPPERLELLEDIEIGNVNGKITFEFKAPTVDNAGCYIEWGELGITNYSIELDVHFTREWLIPVVDDDGVKRSIANLVASGATWDGMVLVGNLEESVIASTVPDVASGTPSDTGAHDFIILADDISYDWSDTMNAPGIAFPAIYSGETTNLFHGFHMTELTVKFSPNKMNTPGGDPIEVSINDMIIDDTGITLEAEVENLIAFGGAEVGDMVASIDRVYLEIQSSNFVEAGIEGRIAIPVNDQSGLEDSLAYTALFNSPLDPAENNNFQIIIEPDQDINNDLLQGVFTLDDTSNLSGYFDKDKKTFSLDLNGDFTWEDATIGPVNEINMELSFQGVGFDYDTSAAQKLTFDAGQWAFASPQKRMGNFPVTIDNIEYNPLTTTGNQLIHGKMNFDVIFNLSDKIGGMTTLGAVMAINDESGTGGKRFQPEFIGGVIDSIAVYANLAAVDIKGSIGFRNNDPVFGDGFIGSLEANFKGPGIKLTALAEFGNTTYLHTGRYRYWRVEAEATFPAPGITFLPGMAFRGFGGGAFNNMEPTASGMTYTFTPKHSSLGFRANAVMATTPKEQTFNADMELLGTFSGSGGMTYIGFTGEFYIGAGFDKRHKAKVSGDVSVSYDFPQKHFNLTANVNVNATPITTPSPANLVLDINGKTNNWYFKFGEPANLNTVNVFGISLYEYLMFGNDIPYPGGFTSTFETGYYNALGVYPSTGGASTGGVGSTTETGKGFALGIGFMFDKSGEKQLTKYSNDNKKHVLSYNLSAGAELHLSFMEYLGSCDGNTPIGINGWRAKGGLGMYGTAAAGVKKYKKNGSVKWDVTVASIAAGAWITGEFPNPYYVAGAIDGNITIFDLISFSFHKDFEKGVQCGNGGAGGGVPVTQGDAAAAQENALIEYINPNTTNNFPIEEPLAVKYGLVPNEVFDVSEQQSNGTVEMRTFKMEVSKNLKIKNETSGVWEHASLTTNENNLGEYLYTKTPPIGALPALPAMLAPPPGIGGMGVAAPMVGAYTAPLGFTPAVAPMPGIGAAPMGIALYPSPGPSDDYDDLPPDPDPVINTLSVDRDYKFTVTATLKEYNGTSWSSALKNNGTPVTQTVVKNFRTGPMVLIALGAPAAF